jgi:hypothetical protein
MLEVFFCKILIKKLKIEGKMKICKICRFGYHEEDIINKYLSFNSLFELKNICQNCLFKLFIKVEGFISEIVKKE